MKQSILPLILVTSLLFVRVEGYADSTDSEKRTPIPIYIKPHPGNHPVRPFSDTQAQADIAAEYSEGLIEMTFTEPEGMAKVYIHDMGAGTALTTVHTISTASTAHIAVPTAPGFYRITITTSPGNEYEGFYTVF